jgi:hypothetical protein
MTEEVMKIAKLLPRSRVQPGKDIVSRQPFYPAPPGL